MLEGYAEYYFAQNKPYTMGSFNALLKNRKYIREYKYQAVIIPNGVPAILSEELFYRVQEHMEKNKRAPARTKAEEEYLLTTKIFCGKCGSSLPKRKKGLIICSTPSSRDF